MHECASEGFGTAVRAAQEGTEGPTNNMNQQLLQASMAAGIMASCGSGGWGERRLG